MRFFKMLLGRIEQGPLSDPETQKRIDEAERIADEVVDRKVFDHSIATSSTVALGSASPLLQALDKVLELVPESPDVLFARSEAHYAILDGETGQAYRKKVLALAPNHFDACMRENYFAEWDHLYCYSAWNERRMVVPRDMLDHQAAGNAVQLVRDRLALSLVILLPASRSGFPQNIAASKWVPLWVDTPHGPAFEHYVLLKLATGEIRRQELTICPYPVEPIHQRHGNWLIRRFCEQGSIFIVFNDGEDVLYNDRYVFPRSLRARLRTIKSRLEKLKLPEDYSARFQRAAQWHVENSSMDDIAW